MGAGAFDILVLMSGDADHSPAIEGVRTLGRQAYVATWGGVGLASRLRRAAFDHIDLLDGIEEFRRGTPGGAANDAPPMAPTSSSGGSTSDEDVAGTSAEATDDVFLAELERAEKKFVGGYVGANHFVTKWRSDQLTSSVIIRGRVLDRLEKAGKVEVYETESGDKAVRRK